MSSRLSVSFCGTITLFMVVQCHTAQAGLIVQHAGSADPTTEGWNANPGMNWVGSVFGQNDSGTQAWSVDDNSIGDKSTYIYDQSISATDIADGNTYGWILSTTLRVASDEVTNIQGLFVAYRDGVTSWQMNFGLDANNDTIVQLEDSFTPVSIGPTYTLPGNATYNQFDLKYDSSAGTADLFVNGIEVLSDFDGAPLAQSAVLWGAGRSIDAGQGNFNAVSFSTIPEPSSFALLGMGALGLVGFRKRKRNQAA